MTPRGTEPPVPCGMCKLGALGITSTCSTFIMNNKINFDQVGTEPPVPSDKVLRFIRCGVITYKL